MEYKGYVIKKDVNMYSVYLSKYHSSPIYSYFESIKDAKDFIDIL